MWHLTQVLEILKSCALSYISRQSSQNELQVRWTEETINFYHTQKDEKQDFDL